MEREKVIKELGSLRDICNAKSNMAIGMGKVAWAGYANTADDAIALLKEQEIVRCKDCKNACIYDDDGVICVHVDSNGDDKHPANWFCADGERKEGL